MAISQVKENTEFKLCLKLTLCCISWCKGVGIYIYIYICIYSKMNRSMKTFVLFKDLFIYFVLTHMYVSSLLLSLENIYGTSPREWGTQWDLNSFVFEVWTVFSWLWIYIDITPLLSFLRVCLPLSASPLIDLWYFICFCHFTQGIFVCLRVRVLQRLWLTLFNHTS